MRLKNKYNETKKPKHKMTTPTYKYLHFVNCSTLMLWDIKRYFMTQISSSYTIVRLGDYIKEESAKYKISDPTKTYGILGVNNQTGIFDAYIEKGSKIKQKYKKMQVGWIAYNPYRINVGSIGMRTDKQDYEYISPAYVVFSCKNGLLPEYLYRLMKTDFFNKFIRENTTGSVRQNLNYSVLSNLQIPLPSLEEQNDIIAAYNYALAKAEQCVQQAQNIDEQIEAYLYEKLGMQTMENNQRDMSSTYLRFFQFKYIKEWGFDKILGTNNKLLYSAIYPNVKLGDILHINPHTELMSLTEKDMISFVPMECVSDEYGEVTKKMTCRKAESKGYTKFMNGDIIWARITPCMQNGKSAVVTNLVNNYGCGSTEFHVLRNNDSNINTSYIHHLLRMPIVLKDAQKSFTGSAGQQRVPKNYLENLRIPLPPLCLQNEIMAHITALRDEQKNLRLQASELRLQAQQQFEQTIFE